MTLMWRRLTVLLLVAGSQALRAEPAVAPAAQLREMNALFLSPYTVDAGHLQIETYLVGYAYAHDKSDGENLRTRIWNIAPTTFRLGVGNDLDLEIALNPHTRVRTTDEAAQSVERQDGFGDILLKAKLNLCGNNGGSFAIGVMPFLKLPTAQDDLGNGAFEGGVTVPLARELPAGWWLFLSPEISVVERLDERGSTAALRNTTTLWHTIVGKLSGYVEFLSYISVDAPEEWYGTANAGCTYVFTEDLQLDAGVLLGVTDTAPDVNPFLGLSVRF